MMAGRRIIILYGSQTGTAQDVAEQIWRESRHLGFTGPVLPMDEYAIGELPSEELAVFVVATTGNGDEPDNMKEFWKFMRRRSLANDALRNLNFACLGLGDSSYEKFNFAAKKLNKRLLQLSAIELQSLGLCDDQHDHGLSGVSLPWISSLWQKIGEKYSIDLGALNAKSKTILKYNIQFLDDTTKLIPMENVLWPYKEPCHQFQVHSNERTTAEDHFQDVRHIKLRFPDEVFWDAGDVLQVRPSNSGEIVKAFFDLNTEHNWGLEPQRMVRIDTNFEDAPLPKVYAESISIECLVRYVWDLNSKPRQRAFELLAVNCEDEQERDKLIEFTTSEGLEDLIAYVNRPRRTLLEVLHDFPHATSKLTLPVMCEMFPVIQMRSFSIASMPSTGYLDLLVAVVLYKTKLSKPRLGLCSNWLKDLKPNVSICGAIKKGTFLIPKALSTPIIMVGPGTGIAPFRSLIQARKLAPESSLVVFFGCRYQDKDFHFRSDLQSWQTENVIKLFLAFSRDQDDKIYVQHLIRKEKILLQNLILQNNGIVLVAGSSNNMPKAVREAFIEALDINEAQLDEMIRTKRYQEETWS